MYTLSLYRQGFAFYKYFNYYYYTGCIFLCTGISYAVDILAYAVLLHLFWPSRSVLFMLNGERPLPMYDLEITGTVKVRKRKKAS